MQWVKKLWEKTVYNKINTKENNWENKIPDTSTLIQTTQYNKDKQILEKKKRRWELRYQILLAYWLLLFLIQKMVNLRIKFLILVV